MAVRHSENNVAIPTGELLKDIMNNNSISGVVVQKALKLNNTDFYNLMEGDLSLNNEMAESLGELFGSSSSIFMNWEKKYRTDLALVNIELLFSPQQDSPDRGTVPE